MTDRDIARDATGAPGPKSRRFDDRRDSIPVANGEAATSWFHGAESSYSAAAPPKARPADKRESDDAPFEVRVEFVQLDGPAGQALRRRQAQIMRRVLQWIADHPDPANR